MYVGSGEKISSSRQKALYYAQKAFSSDNLHPSYMSWRKHFRIWQGFYDGSGQWTQRDLETLAERDQFAITVNLIQAYVDSLLGVEIQSRHRAACRNSSESEDIDELAVALTHVLFEYQQRERIPYKCTQKARDMFVGGMGWSEIGTKDNLSYYNYIPALNIVPDFDDLSNQFDSMRRVHRKIWMDPAEIASLWPKAKNYLDLSSDPSDNFVQGIYTPEIDDRNSDLMDYNFFQTRKNKIMIVETQNKVPKQAYRGIDKNGRAFETFDEETAEEISESKKDIEEYASTRIMRTLFVGNCLLEHAPLIGDLPGRKDFSYIPCVWKRRYIDGVPYGLVDSIMDIQLDCNVRLTKSIYLLNSNRIVLEGNPQMGGDIEKIRKELKTQDSVIIVPPGTKFEISSNSQLGMEQMKIVQDYLLLMQRITGINDEMLGFQTNATSAVSQEVRQNNALRKNIFAFDTFKDMKTREALFFLQMFQNTENNNYLVEIISDDQRKKIILNLSREVFGNEVVFNDVRNFPLSLYIEEVPDYESSFEEESAAMQAIMSNPNGMAMIQSPTFLKYFGKIRQPEKIAAEMQQTIQRQNAMEQGIDPQQQLQQQAQQPTQ
jgi:hypothetical protein